MKFDAPDKPHPEISPKHLCSPSENASFPHSYSQPHPRPVPHVSSPPRRRQSLHRTSQNSQSRQSPGTTLLITNALTHDPPPEDEQTWRPGLPKRHHHSVSLRISLRAGFSPQKPPRHQYVNLMISASSSRRYIIFERRGWEAGNFRGRRSSCLNWKIDMRGRRGEAA